MFAKRLTALSLIVVLMMIAGVGSAQVGNEQLLLLASEWLSIPVGYLEIVNQAEVSFDYLGVEAQRAKLIDTRTGATYDFAIDLDQQVINVEELLDLDREERRNQLGALTPEAYDAVINTAPDEIINVAIWVAGELALPEAPDSDEGLSAGEIDEMLAAIIANHHGEVGDLVGPVAEQLVQLGADPESDFLAPTIRVGLTPDQLLQVAQWPEVEEVSLIHETESFMEHARRAVHANVVNSRGYTGINLNAGYPIKIGVIEQLGYIDIGHPFIDMSTVTYDQTWPCRPELSDPEHHGDHPAHVVSAIKSIHSPHRGVATDSEIWLGVACRLPNGPEQEGIPPFVLDIMKTRLSDRAVNMISRVLNLSWGSRADTMDQMSRHYDTLVRNLMVTTVIAAGNGFPLPNFFFGCDPDIVGTPANAYNAITVGSYKDHNTTDCNDDTISSCLSWYNPSSLNKDRIKPEVAAPGEGIYVVSNRSPWIVEANGTSISAPIVSGLAALLMSRQAKLMWKPEAVKALLMASAINNIEGIERLSTKDGAGGVHAEAADNILTGSVGGWEDWYVSPSNTQVHIKKLQLGEQNLTLKAALAWSTDPSYKHYARTPSIDLDLYLYAPDGTLVSESTSYDNTYEVVQFDTRGLAGEYTLKVVTHRCNSSSRVALAWFHAWLPPYLS
jgi:subtilisin family serine protease